MKPEHRIRLPRPWNVTVDCETDPNRTDVRMTTIEFVRNFQRPSGLLESSRIEIEVQVEKSDLDRLLGMECLLNELPLASSVFIKGRMTSQLRPDQLRPTNRLVVREVWRGEQADTSVPRVEIVLS